MKTAIPSATGTAKARFPDDENNQEVIDVKNTGKQGYTSQIQDYDLYAQTTGKVVRLVVRGGGGTRITGPLQKVVKTGRIIIDPRL